MRKYFLHLIVYPAYAIGGIYFFYMDPIVKSIYFVFLILVFAYFKRLIGLSILWVSLYLGMLFILQKMLFDRGTLYNYLGLIVVFGIPYLLWKIYRFSFLKIFVNIAFLLSIFSLIFWALSNLSQKFFLLSLEWPALLKTDPWVNESYIFYSTREARSIFGLLRNNGGFWEPGAFGTTLVLALLFSILLYPRIFHIKNLILIITIITTFSTSAYFALILVLIVYAYNSSFSLKQANNRVIVMIIIGVIAILSLDFLGEKVQIQYTNASERRLTEATSGRFFSVRKSLTGITQQPLLGEYLVQERMEGEKLLHKEDLGLYGFFYLIQRIGIPTFILFLYFIYRGFLQILKNNDYKYFVQKTSKLMILAWLILMFSQNLYWMPVSLYIFWVGIDSQILLMQKK